MNWSTGAGDLRAAHMVGLHALQILPLFGFLVGRWKIGGTEAARTLAVFAFTTLYVLLGAALFWQAMSGSPVVGLCSPFFGFAGPLQSIV